MRRKMIATAAGILLLTVLLIPLANMLSTAQEALDADHMVQPMLDLLEQSPQVRANVAVGQIMDIEDAWGIEDTRQEAQTPLVGSMRNGEHELGYDEASRTFFCTLGLSGGDWPELALYAQGAEGMEDLSVAWIDDYTYDDRSDAIREGYRYELMAYTDTQYEYIELVFTGLPIVTLQVHGGADALGDTYTPARMGVASAEYAAINSGAWTHVRGGGYPKPIDKPSYRVEFHELGAKGDQKAARSVLGMKEDTDWLLISNAQDPTALRNHLCWDMWRRWNEGAEAPMELGSRMVELFVDNAYMGLYQVMERVNPEEELVRIGGNPQTDTLARIIVSVNIGNYPVLDRDQVADLWIEHRYEAKDRHERTFERIEDYARLMMKDEYTLSDEEFIELAQKRIDTRELMSYFLFSQVCGLTQDNIHNNLYIWALGSDAEYQYRLSPWDMDMSLFTPTNEEDMGWGGRLEVSFALPVRMLDLNVNQCREIMWEIWTQKRETLLLNEAICTWIMDTAEEIEASGAYHRETEKWYGAESELPAADMMYYTQYRIENVEYAMEERWLSQETGKAETTEDL